MLNEKNIEDLKTRLLSLGFPGGLERGLRAQVSLQREAFTLQYRRQKQDDTVSVSLHFQRQAHGGGYLWLYYEACLRKRVAIPAVLIQGVDSKDLERRMQAVDWQMPLPGPFSDDTAGALPPSSWQREEAIEAIITDLHRLEESAEGTALALQLKWTFWAGTPLEAFIGGINAVRNSGEVSQRFYFFEGEEGITLEEACRFLAHRWREKKWQAQKKHARLPSTGLAGSTIKGADKKQEAKAAKQKGAKET